MKNKKAVIIIPTYNENENILALVPALQAVFAKITNWQMHILVVDDSSPDGTAQSVTRMQKQYSNLHLLVNAEKKGLGAAYLSGMKESFDHLGADIIFEFDADFSHDPERIPQFLKAADDGADFVVGSRYIRGGSIPSDWGMYRKFLSVVGNLVIMSVFTDFRIHDWTSGYRAIKRNVYLAVHQAMRDPRLSGYTFQAAFLRKAVQQGFKVSEVPFKFVDRKVGKSKLGSDNIKSTLVFIFSDRFNEIIHSHIFKFAVVGGIGFVITSVGSFVFAALPYIKTHYIINPSFIATAIATECAIISNFILNNFFTFSDRKVVTLENVLPKFLQFNFGSLGALIISSTVVGIGTLLTGEFVISKMFWLVTATAIGMFVNYFVYSKFIWKRA